MPNLKAIVVNHTVMPCRAVSMVVVRDAILPRHSRLLAEDGGPSLTFSTFGRHTIIGHLLGLLFEARRLRARHLKELAWDICFS